MACGNLGTPGFAAGEGCVPAGNPGGLGFAALPWRRRPLARPWGPGFEAGHGWGGLRNTTAARGRRRPSRRRCLRKTTVVRVRGGPPCGLVFGKPPRMVWRPAERSAHIGQGRHSGPAPPYRSRRVRLYFWPVGPRAGWVARKRARGTTSSGFLFPLDLPEPRGHRQGRRGSWR